MELQSFREWYRNTKIIEFWNSMITKRNIQKVNLKKEGKIGVTKLKILERFIYQKPKPTRSTNNFNPKVKGPTLLNWSSWNYTTFFTEIGNGNRKEKSVSKKQTNKGWESRDQKLCPWKRTGVGWDGGGGPCKQLQTLGWTNSVDPSPTMTVHHHLRSLRRFTVCYTSCRGEWFPKSGVSQSSRLRLFDKPPFKPLSRVQRKMKGSEILPMEQ